MLQRTTSAGLTVERFTAPYDKCERLLKMMVQNICQKIAEKLDFVENSNLLRKPPKEESHYNNVAGLQSVTLLR